MKNFKKSIALTINLLLFVLIFSQFVPYFRNFSVEDNSFLNYFHLSLIVVIYFFSFIYNPLWINNNILYILLLIFLNLYFFLIPLLNNNFHVFLRYFSIIYLLFYAFLVSFNKSNKIIKFENIILLILVFLPYFYLISIYQVLDNSFIIRLVYSDSTTFNDLRMMGVLGYPHVYMSNVLLPYLFYRLLYQRTSIFFFFLISLNLVLGTIFLFLSGFTISLLLLLLGYFLVLLGKKRLLYIYIFSFFLLLFISVPILDFLVSLDFLPRSFKVDSFIDLLNGNLTNNLLDGRLLAYTKSFDTFIRYFFFGAIYEKNLLINDFNLPEVIIGLHSTILDMFALYGFLYYSIFLLFLFSTNINYYFKTKKSVYFILSLMFFSVLLLNVDVPLIAGVYYFLLSNYYA